MDLVEIGGGVVVVVVDDVVVVVDDVVVVVVVGVVATWWSKVVVVVGATVVVVVAGTVVVVVSTRTRPRPTVWRHRPWRRMAGQAQHGDQPRRPAPGADARAGAGATHDPVLP